MSVEKEIQKAKTVAAQEQAAREKDTEIKEAIALETPEQVEEEGHVVIGPMGTVLRAKPLISVLERFKHPGKLLTQFELVVKNYSSRKFYAWANDDDETAGLCRSGAYRILRKEDILSNSPLPIHITEAGAVKWRSLLLVEITAEQYQQQYKFPEELALSVLVRQNEQEYRDRVRGESKGLAHGFVGTDE